MLQSHFTTMYIVDRILEKGYSSSSSSLESTMLRLGRALGGSYQVEIILQIVLTSKDDGNGCRYEKRSFVSTQGGVRNDDVVYVRPHEDNDGIILLKRHS